MKRTLSNKNFHISANISKTKKKKERKEHHPLFLRRKGGHYSQLMRSAWGRQTHKRRDLNSGKQGVGGKVGKRAQGKDKAKIPSPGPLRVEGERQKGDGPR